MQRANGITAKMACQSQNNLYYIILLIYSNSKNAHISLVRDVEVFQVM